MSYSITDIKSSTDLQILHMLRVWPIVLIAVLMTLIAGRDLSVSQDLIVLAVLCSPACLMYFIVWRFRRDEMRDKHSDYWGNLLLAGNAASGIILGAAYSIIYLGLSDTAGRLMFLVLMMMLVACWTQALVPAIRSNLAFGIPAFGSMILIMGRDQLWIGIGIVPPLLVAALSIWSLVRALLDSLLNASITLRESEAKFRHLSENANDMVSKNAFDGTFIYASPSFKRLLGYSPDELIGRKIQELGCVEDTRRLKQAVFKAAHDHEPFVMQQSRFRHKSGHWEWVEAAISLEWDDVTGKILTLSAVGRVITERVRTEEALRESEAKFRHLSENANDMVSKNAFDGTLIYASPSFKRLLGYSPDELIGRNIQEIGHEEDTRHLSKAVSKAVRDREPFVMQQYRIRHKSGHWEWVESAISLEWDDVTGKILSLSAVGRVITERVRAEEALRESEAKFRHLSENANDMVSILAGDGTFAYTSPSFERLLGYRPEEINGHSLREFIHPEDIGQVYRKYFEILASGGVYYSDIHRIRHKSGHWEWLEAAVAIEDDGVAGMRSKKVFTVFRVITQRVRDQEELQEALVRATMADRGKSSFLAHMSHEIRTPLNAILGFSEIMRDQLFGPLGGAQYLDYAKDIYNSGAHLLSLINEMLDLSKIEAGKFDLTEGSHHLGAILESSCRLLHDRAARKQIHLSVNQNVQPYLLCDQRLLKQVMLNIIGNAIKFTPEGGSVTIESNLDAAGNLILTVSDTGIGIAPEDTDTVMKPFGQARRTSDLAAAEPGTGLGLPLSKSFIEMHGGRLELTSELGAGTKVSITLPASRILDNESEYSQFASVF